MEKSYEAPGDTVQEKGYPFPPSIVKEGIVPQKGGLVLPHYITFSQLVNFISRTYRYTHDEALKHDRINALAIRREPVVMEALRSRQVPTTQLNYHIEALDEENEEEVRAAIEVEEIIRSIPRFQQYKRILLEALWYGRYGVQNIYEWDWGKQFRRLMVMDYFPINGDKLVFRYSGQVGVLVHAKYEGSYSLSERGRVHFLNEEEMESVVVHKFEPEDSDFTEGDMGGVVHGTGIRGRIYWLWWLRNHVLEWLMEYLERVGAGGLTIYYYEAGNDDSLTEVKKAAEDQYRNNTILFPRFKGGDTGGPGISRLEPSLAGASLLRDLIMDYFDNAIRRYILGGSISPDISQEDKELRGGSFSRIIRYDAIDLADTLTNSLVKTIYKYTFPSIRPGKFVFNIDKPNAEEVLATIREFYEMGGRVNEDDLRETLGLAPPEEGKAILSKSQSLTPMGVPEGVPIEGEPGPRG